MLAGCAIVPVSWLRNYVPSLAGLSYFWTILTVLVPILVSGVFYILGAYANKRKRRPERGARGGGQADGGGGASSPSPSRTDGGAALKDAAVQEEEMRIVAGKYRGRVLQEFRGMDIRPTADRVKESVFQILTPYFQGARVLDLFAGSGALGIESLSRGAAEAVFNDSSKESLKVCRANLQKVGERAAVYNLDYKSCLRSVSGKFRLIFCDPPYRMECLAEILALVKERGLLEEGGLVVFEGEREESAPEGWEAADVRRYGRTRVTFFRPAARRRAMKKCVFAGTFDPFTLGHDDTVKKCLALFDEVVDRHCRKQAQALHVFARRAPYYGAEDL